MNTRLDTYLTTQKVISSREKAKQLISDGKVFINGDLAKKASQKVSKSDEITVENTHIYVSRSAHKLLKAIKVWNIKVEGKVCLDIGSSTGGFTEVLLENGAKKVYSVDVGMDQLHESLKNNSRVVSMEGQDIRDLNSLDESADLIVIDVSFISLKHIIPLLNKFGSKSFEVLALLKPQFEVGKKYLKKGIVKDENRTEEVKKEIIEMFTEEGFDVQPLEKSPIKGKEGNQEYLIFARKSNKE